MARWTLRGLTAIPAVCDGEPDDPTWYPLQHAPGIDTFGVNLFVATRLEQTLFGEHDEEEPGPRRSLLPRQLEPSDDSFVTSFGHWSLGMARRHPSNAPLR